MKKILVAVTVAAAVVILAGCSAISAGTVTGKNYEPAYSYTTMQCYSYDKNMNCTVQMPVQQHVSEKWRFNLDDGRDTGWVYVDETTYHEFEIGDSYGVNKAG